MGKRIEGAECQSIVRHRKSGGEFRQASKPVKFNSAKMFSAWPSEADMALI
jgi:hypothetical protein